MNFISKILYFIRGIAGLQIDILLFEPKFMRNYNDVITVTERVDLVTYLQTKYKVKRHEYTSYGRYY